MPVSITCVPLITNVTIRHTIVAVAWPASTGIVRYDFPNPDGEARGMLRRPLVTYVDFVPSTVVR